MGLNETFIFYFVIGCGVAIAVLVTNGHRKLVERYFVAATAWIFWPVYLPILLSSREPENKQKPAVDPPDELSDLTSEVEQELSSAIRTLNGSAANLSTNEIKLAWQRHTKRIHEMDELLTNISKQKSAELPNSTNGRVNESEQARQQNFERLGRVRETAYENLMSSVASVREVVSMIHLARFTDETETSTDRIAAQIDSALEILGKS